MKEPKLRFPEFTSEWELRKLNEITDVRDGTHDSPKYVKEGHPFITSKNVSNGFINYNDVQYVTDEDYEKINKRSKVDIHDILMGMIGTIGNLALIREEPDFAIKNVALIKYTGDIDYKYLYQALQSGCVTNQLSIGMDGGTQKFVSLKKIRELNIPFPQELEQKKIGECLHSVDTLIQSAENELEGYRELKQGMLQKMFPKKGEATPEIRFPEFTDDWEEHELSEMFNYEQPSKYIVKNDNYEGCTKYPVLTANKGFILGYTDETEGIYNKGEAIIFDDFTCDHKFVNFSFKVKSSAIKILTPKDNYNLPFLSELLNVMNQQPLSHQRHWISVMQPSIVFAPSLEEQKKIGEYFSSLDNLIILQQKEIDSYKELKKGLLQQMFC